MTFKVSPLPTCKDCKWWVPITTDSETWGGCEYGFPPLPFWVTINAYGAINPRHSGCPTWEGREDGGIK